MSKSESLKQVKALDKSLSAYEKELQQAYNESLKNIRGQLAALYEASNGDFTEAAKYNRLTKLEKEIAQEIKALTGKTAKTLDRGIIAQFEEARLREMFVIEKDIKAVADFNMLNREQVREAIKNPYDRIGFIQRDRDNAALLTKQMRQEISQGLIQGKSFQQTARTIRDRMEIGGGNALRIVRTESKRARGKAKQSTQEEAQELGINMQKQFVATIDGSTRDSHQALDGVTIDIDEDFVTENGASGPGPGQFNDPAEDINCRCTVISIVAGIQPNSRRVREVGIVDYESFDKWAETREVPERTATRVGDKR